MSHIEQENDIESNELHCPSGLSLLCRQEGYDYEFVPPLDVKYECAICLMGLRSPMQTSCGHRFCKDCIMHAMSESSNRCPVDNNPLSQSDLFPDSCTEREVLHLSVHCPNHSLGCPRLIDLQYVDHHARGCGYQPTICPNEKCSSTVLQKELEDHLSNHCMLRATQCSLCRETYTVLQEQLHSVVCSGVTVPCEMCGTMIARGDQGKHMTSLCVEATVACAFAEHGCQWKQKRKDMNDHMTVAMPIHLQLLASAYKRMNTFLSDLSRTVSVLNSGNFSRQTSFQGRDPCSLMVSEPTNYLKSMESNHCSSTAQFGQAECSEFRNEDKLKQNLKFGNPKHVDDGRVGMSNGRSPTLPRQQEVILQDLSRKSLDLDQRLLEQSIISTNLAHRVEEVDSHLTDLSVELPGRFCHGEFVWRVCSFGEVCGELQTRPNRTHHSPYFYTSPSGYKFCLRLNLTWKSDCFYLTLFIHLMQGDNDQFLPWPFRGSISLSVLDRGNSSPKRHLTETMSADPALQAFSRPESPRNPKGFGFTEFAELSSILQSPNGCYVVNDSLFIKAVVRAEH